MTNYHNIKQERTLSWAEKLVDINQLRAKSEKCPKCGKRGKWRNALMFEHEMRCYPCTGETTTWEPDETLQELYYQEIENIINQQGQNGDGI